MTPSITKIFITGANKGLGYYASKEIVARPNVHLIISCRGSWTNESEGKALADIKSAVHADSKLDAIGGVDVAKDDALKKAIKELSDLTDNSLDILINNAGILTIINPEKDPIRELWIREFNTNIFGPVVLTELALPLLKASSKKKPLIFNVSSDLGSMTLRGDPSWTHYGIPISAYPSSKAALNAHTVYMSVMHKDITTVSWNPGK